MVSPFGYFLSLVLQEDSLLRPVLEDRDEKGEELLRIIEKPAILRSDEFINGGEPLGHDGHLAAEHVDDFHG